MDHHNFGGGDLAVEFQQLFDVFIFLAIVGSFFFYFTIFWVSLVLFEEEIEFFVGAHLAE